MTMMRDEVPEPTNVIKLALKDRRGGERRGGHDAPGWAEGLGIDGGRLEPMVARAFGRGCGERHGAGLLGRMAEIRQPGGVWAISPLARSGATIAARGELHN